MATRRELKEAIGHSYRAAGSWERRQILDELTRVTGYLRKQRCGCCIGSWSRCQRGRIYDEAVRQGLTMLWEAADRICGKRGSIGLRRSCWLQD